MNEFDQAFLHDLHIVMEAESHDATPVRRVSHDATPSEAQLHQAALEAIIAREREEALQAARELLRAIAGMLMLAYLVWSWTR
jgi:DNA-binding FadR family transcriptional regulator